MSKRSLTAVFLSLLVAACGGDGGTGLDDADNMGPGAGNATREVKADPSFASDIQEIFNRKGCTASSCHGSSAQAGLNLTPGNAYTNLVNVLATQVALYRVLPGDPANSYLIQKVEGTASFGARMPLTGSALDNIDISNLRNWINQGAKNN